MKIAEPYKCDAPGCGKMRGSDSNHWWVLWRSDSTEGLIEILPWEKGNPDCDATKHACGIACAIKITNDFMQEILCSTE